MDMNANMANRQCCDLDIREYGSNKPWMYADFCNTTTANFSSESVFAMKKGAKAIKFENQLDGTMSITFQAHPFRLYAMLSDGEVETSAIVPVKEDITCETDGDLTLNQVPVSGTVFVYEQGDFGGTDIKGSVTGSTFTAAQTEDIEQDKVYTVGYLVSKTTGVKKVSFNNKKIPKYFRITQETVDKDETGALIPIKMTAFKASPQRNMEWSWASEGDPASMTITFDVLEDNDGNVLEIAEIAD